MLETLTAQTFSPYVGETFRLILDGEPQVNMELVSVTETNFPAAARGTVDPLRRMSFSLLFLEHDHPSAYLPQRIYHFEHEQLGAMDLFLVPLGPVAGGMRYEVIFN
ncbi:MAG TPA: hypothetical protein VJ183_13195 [Chloroflexia bacterium]|nr:hypothetical protein [Chloroflexia bacterium]